MIDFVPRTCTEIGEVSKDDAGTEPASRSLEEFRDVEAYVLLGAPGAGKTTTFTQEADCPKAHRVTARDFITFDDHPEWHNTTLFIDGLDEMRAGSLDGRTPLDKIRGKLEQLDRPRFRLSCREADWFGANDRDRLKAVSRDGKVTVLRLDPLTETAILKILRDNLKVDDPEKFIREARQKGLETLLTNPQSLSMLAKAVAGSGGDWPETRLQTFDVACRTLLREHNREHQVAKPDNVAVFALLDAAGRLCAVQLLTGKVGYALPGAGSDHEYLSLEQISGGDPKILRHVLGTKLFTAPTESPASPVHRHVAEFLAGRYLAGLIENGLSIERILALMTGDDGGVVSELRGLSAWLASHSPTSRIAIIERDPIGTVLYGDIRDFSIDEKRRLIHGLYREAQKNLWFFDSLEGMDSRFGDLATPDMEEVFKEALTNPMRDETHQGLVVCLVEALRHGPAIPKLTDVLLDVVRDDSRWPRIGYRALDTILQQDKNDEQTNAMLMKLLADVNDGSVPDPDDELLGRLLNGLYPSRLSALEILRYLRTPKTKNLYGAYKLFWYDVAMDSTNAQCAELLDILVERYNELLEKIQEDLTDTRNLIYHLPSNLLVRFLKTSQEKIVPHRLFSWLKVAAWNYHEMWVPPDGTEGIRAWLSEHHETHKAMIAACIEDCSGEQRFDICVDMKRHRLLFGATPPPDFGSWCLEQATNAIDENASKWYVHEVAYAVHRHDDGLTWETVSKRLASHPSLKQAFRERLSKREESKNRGNALREESKNETSKEQQEFQDLVKKHVTALRENRCPPSLLNHLAAAYFDEPIDRLFEGQTSIDRLCNLLGEDTDLIETVLTALRDSINRSDVPTDTEIIRLRAGNQKHVRQRYFLELPFLAGLEELPEPEKKPPLNERQIRQAIAFYYNSRALPYYNRGKRPHWYRWLLARHPEVVSDVLIEFVRSGIRGGEEHFSEVHELARSKEYEEVARLAALSLLKLFPVRCTSAQLRSLNVLLIAALFHCEKQAFEKLIERKLSLQSMNVGQRVYWLAAGLLASPASYRERIEAAVSGHEQRIRHLAEFLTASPANLLDRFDVQDMELLIRLIGGSYRPYSDSSPWRKFPTDLPLVIGFINRLASVPSRDATVALESLSSDESLHPWRYRLLDAAYQQNVTRREASFRHKDVEQVLQVLGNLKPANAADLAALTIDILSDIAKRIRDGNTSDWRQYWNVDSHNRPQNPKPEPGCRDALLSDLRLKLERVEVNVKIDAQREVSYADDKSGDIGVTHGDFNVPVEIKKSTHRDLWRAIREQLIAKYTRDPGADGYGIYLVFWFGTEGCQMPPSGKRPTSAHELQERLMDTLSPDEKFKISICVIDVSKR